MIPRRPYVPYDQRSDGHFACGTRQNVRVQRWNFRKGNFVPRHQFSCVLMYGARKRRLVTPVTPEFNNCGIVNWIDKSHFFERSAFYPIKVMRSSLGFAPKYCRSGREKASCKVYCFLTVQINVNRTPVLWPSNHTNAVFIVPPQVV